MLEWPLNNANALFPRRLCRGTNGKCVQIAVKIRNCTHKHHLWKAFPSSIVAPRRILSALTGAKSHNVEWRAVPWEKAAGQNACISREQNKSRLFHRIVCPTRRSREMHHSYLSCTVPKRCTRAAKACAGVSTLSATNKRERLHSLHRRLIGELNYQINLLWLSLPIKLLCSNVLWR